ncbi:hypothetical protein BGX28_008406 [Mortierella sp. GBA30]|nr:hypothetical protein BGX28_008406 [Mortierella sp. GBA30]
MQLETRTLQLESLEKDDKMLHMQDLLHNQTNQALDRLATLQKHARAIFVQNFELHEYPIQRLFVILPVDQGKWNPKWVLENKLRQHFLCECVDRTVEAGKGGGQSRIHIAKLDGYEIRNGTEFFLKYGKYMPILLYILKTGQHTIDTPVFPAPASHILASSIDYSIEYMKALAADNPILENINTTDDYEAVEGSDLRQLATFLQTNDDENEQQAFATLVEVGGRYDLQLGDNFDPALAP